MAWTHLDLVQLAKLKMELKINKPSKKSRHSMLYSQALTLFNIHGY